MSDIVERLRKKLYVTTDELGLMRILQPDLNEAADEIERLRAALTRIATTEFINYENTGQGSYGTGISDGHRLAAQWAREALNDDD